MSRPFQREPRDLIEEIEQDAPHFGFFQAVRLLSLTARQYGGRRRGLLPAYLRFRTPATLTFPPSELVKYRPAEPDGPLDDELTVAFMGLIGPNGALPPPYTELVYDRDQNHRDYGLHAFLDLFGHRATALFYSAWHKYRYWLDVEDGGRGGITQNLLDISGVGLDSLRDKLGEGQTSELVEDFFAYYAGLLSQRPISAQVMELVIRGFFGAPAKVEQFVGQWIAVPPEEQTRLGQGACVLGLSALSGDRIWDRQTKIQVRIGPMKREQFWRLLPGEPGAKALDSLVRFMVGHGLAADVTLVLDRREVPQTHLDADQPPRFGCVWLNTRPMERDPDEMSYRLIE